MAAEKTRRKLFKVAKELNLSHQTIIEFLEKKGYAVSGLNTPITDEMHDEILKRFAQEKVKADKIAKREIESNEAVQKELKKTFGTKIIRIHFRADGFCIPASFFYFIRDNLHRVLDGRLNIIIRITDDAIMG